MRIYAKQVQPEYQESPIFYEEDFPDNIVVFGNKTYKEHTIPVFDTVLNVLENEILIEILENISSYEQWYKNATEAITKYLPPSKGKYNIRVIHELKNIIYKYSSCSNSLKDEILCKVLSVVTGKEWDCYTIRGYSQSEWQRVYYQVNDWSRETISSFESEYFNKGTEWIVHDEETAPKIPEDIGGYSVYCTSRNYKDIKNEIEEEILKLRRQKTC